MPLRAICCRDVSIGTGGSCYFKTDINALPRAQPGTRFQLTCAFFSCSNIPTSVSHKRWHHVVITWASRHGDWQFFIDGVKVANGKAKRNHVIKSGRLVLGQTQDGTGKKMAVKKGFQGKLGNLNMWDKVEVLFFYFVTVCNFF